jgi:acyl-coenzyme A synthetase/AMP-(fatty) acid ligase
MMVENSFCDHIDAVRASSQTLKYVIVIGQPLEGELSYEALVTQYLGQQAKEATVSYDDPLWFFYTSGTTGKPKAGILTHGQMAFVVTNHLADLIPGTRETDCSIYCGCTAFSRCRHSCLTECGAWCSDYFVNRAKA